MHVDIQAACGFVMGGPLSSQRARLSSLWIAICMLVSLLGLSLQALAAPKTGPERAEELHQMAVEQSRSGDVDRAILLWEEAQGIHPTWKYAFNLASNFAFLEQWQKAWAQTERAEALGIPPKHHKTVFALREKVGEALFKSQAWIRLKVTPPQAEVTRNGLPWSSPHQMWTDDARSHLKIRAEGFASVDLVWKHPPGRRHENTIRLHPAQVSAPAVMAPSETKIPVDTQQVTTTKPMPPASSRYGGWEWAAMGTGAVAVAIGGGLLGWGEAIVDDMAALNQSPGADVLAYNDDYTRLDDRLTGVRVGGWSLVGSS